MVSDLDVRTSDVHKYVDAITIFSFVLTIMFYFLDLYNNLGVFSTIRNGSMFLPILGVLLFLGLVFYGSHQPHRSFLHSLLGLFVLSIIAYFCFGKVWLPFFIGMTSHIVLDLFNKKNIRLFYPSKKGYCFNLCEYGGFVDHILLYVLLVFIVLKLFEI